MADVDELLLKVPVWKRDGKAKLDFAGWVVRGR